jgi:two-component system, chemotaxis family, CheB/CheR fusion protein
MEEDSGDQWKRVMNPETNPPPALSEKTGHNKFPIVGVGASAGGLESFALLLESLPAKTGMAFVLVQHLDPNYKSMLSELLARKTIIPLMEAQNGMRVEPDHVYLIPPNKDMTIGDGHLVLRPRTQEHGRHMSIDSFLHSLAEVQRSASIGVVLSGNATDGTLGLKAIKAEGGITFVQDPDTAKFAGMPRSAIAAGCADYVLPVDKIAKELASLGEHPYLRSGDDDEEMTDPSSRKEVLGDGTRVFALLRKSSGVDFSSYKQSTIRRRISRRMLLHKIPTMDAYAEFLRENPGELDALYQDILIKVTRFFRDPEVFEFLSDTIFPQIIENNRTLDVPIRIWAARKSIRLRSACWKRWVILQPTCRFNFLRPI